MLKNTNLIKDKKKEKMMNFILEKLILKMK